jgi:prepilin-type N-terminal cleavage/methylation domain-containing protein
MKKRLNQQGFTLMELMVVIVIVAILAAVAVPLYINYVKDAKRTEAKGAMAAIISAEQVYYQSSATSGSAAYLKDDDLTDEIGLKVDLSEVGRSWTVVITDAGTTSFTVTATGKGDADGLFVCCTYDRATGATWGDSQAECSAGSGGGNAPRR